MFKAIVSFLIQYLVFASMLSIGLAVRRADIEDIRRRPKLYVRALLVIEIGVPLLAIAVVAILSPPWLAAETILLMSICAGAPFIPRVTKQKGEKRHGVVGLNILLLAAILAPVAVPIWVSVIDRSFSFGLTVSPAIVIKRVVPAIIAPLLLGAGVRRVLPRGADLLARLADDFFRVALVVAVVVVLYVGIPVLFEVRPMTVLAAFLVVLGSALMGFWASRPNTELGHAVGVAAALGNPALALAVVAASYVGFKAAALMAAYVIFRKLALIPFELIAKRRGGRGGRRPAAKAPREGGFAAGGREVQTPSR